MITTTAAPPGLYTYVMLPFVTGKQINIISSFFCSKDRRTAAILMTFYLHFCMLSPVSRDHVLIILSEVVQD